MRQKPSAAKAASRRRRDPSYRRHATGQATVRLGGRDFYLGTYESPESREKYYRFLAAWVAEGRPRSWSGPRDDGPGVEEKDSTTVGEVMVAYLDHADAYYVKHGQPTSEVAVIKEALRHLNPVRRLPATDFGPKALKRVRRSMIAGDLARSTVNGYVARIKRMFAWATEEEMVPPDIHHGLQAVRGLRHGRSAAKESDPVRPVPDAHVDAILPHVSAEVAAMIRLQILTGMRPGEVVGMRVGDLSMSADVWTYRPSSHKTEHLGKDRTVHLGPKAQAVVRPFLKPDLNAYLFAPVAAEMARRDERRRRAKHRRRTRQRKPFKRLRAHYTTDAYRRAITRACGQAGVPRWSPNQLRHNAATRIRREFGIELTRAVLGHASAATSEIYAELDQQKVEFIMSKHG